MPEEIKKLQDELKKVTDTVRRLESVRNSPLDRTNDLQSQKIIDQRNASSALSTFWDEYLYITPFLADTDRFLDVSFGGTVTIDSSGITLDTGVVSLNSASLSLDVSSSIVSLFRETRFKATVSLNSSTNILATLYSLSGSTASTVSEVIGFRFVDGSIYGFSQAGSGESTMIPLGSYTNSVYAVYELLYDSGGIKFFIDGSEKGSIVSNLPDTDVAEESLISIFSASVITRDTDTKTMVIPYVEFAQKRT